MQVIETTSATPNKHELRSRATRAAILEAAGKLFVEKGFANTSTEKLVQMAGVTRGALYYQFEDKTDLFRAVVEDMAQRVADEIRIQVRATREQTGDSWQALKAGVRAFLETNLRPEVRRVLSLEGPAVLGVKSYRVIDRRCSYGLLLEEVSRLKREGMLPGLPDEALAQVIAGGVRGATLFLVEANNSDEIGHEQIEVAMQALDRMLEGMRSAAGSPVASPSPAPGQNGHATNGLNGQATALNGQANGATNGQANGHAAGTIARPF